jgi:hypothetical protein
MRKHRVFLYLSKHYCHDRIDYYMYDLKEFDVWNSQKKKIQSDTTEVNFFPKEGEVWMSAVGRVMGTGTIKS